MTEFIRLCTGFLAAVLKSRAGLQVENLALRHQLCVYQRSVKRPKVKPADRILWSLLASCLLIAVAFAVTDHPTSAWTAQQVVEAFPWDKAPKYLLRDRDRIYGDWFRRRVNNMGIEEVLTAPHSPWQNPYSERLNGSIRRECLDHVIVFSERHLRRVLAGYIEYYNSSRTHLSLDKDNPNSRPVQTPQQGDVVAVPQVGGLHHRYERRAA